MKHLSFVVLLAGASALSLAQGSLRAEIAAMNGSINRAIMKKDVVAFSKAVKGGVTPDFKYSEPGGKPMGFDGMVAGMKQGFAMYSKVEKVSTKLVSVKESGSTGSAVTQHTMEAVTTGADKKSHKMVFVGTSTDTYRKVKGRWMMASMTMKTDKMTMDGKPMPMGH